MIDDKPLSYGSSGSLFIRNDKLVFEYPIELVRLQNPMFEPQHLHRLKREILQVIPIYDKAEECVKRYEELRKLEKDVNEKKRRLELAEKRMNDFYYTDINKKEVKHG